MNQNPLVQDVVQNFNQASVSFANLSATLPQLLPAAPPAPANNQLQQDIGLMQQDIGIMQQDMRLMREGIQLLTARSANGSYDHAPGDNIQWPPAVAGGQPARQLPQHLPATWTEVTRAGERQLGNILRAYNLAPGPTMEAKLKQIRHYIGLRLYVND